MQLRLAANASRALPVPAIVEHEEVVADATIELETGRPCFEVARIAVKEEHESVRIFVRKIQRIEHGTRNGNPNLLERLREAESVVAGQRGRMKEQSLLR